MRADLFLALKSKLTSSETDIAPAHRDPDLGCKKKGPAHERGPSQTSGVL
jgi:hypothetical protein